MFNFLNKKSTSSKNDLRFEDIDGNPLKEGDIVNSLRYDLGKCIIRRSGKGYEYESIESGKTVNWSKMIDARTKSQKVRRI